MVFLECNMNYKYILIHDERNIRTVTLNRIDVHNAFNDEFIDEMIDAFENVSKEDSIQVVKLNANGKSFSAGADLNWMKKMINYSKSDNHKDSLKLSKMFSTMNNIPQLLFGVVHGHAFGGALGMISVCDYVISSHKPLFSFSEVRLGLIPAVISEFVIPKIGYSQAQAYFTSGLRFDAQRAKEIGLIHECVDESQLEARSEKLVESFLKAGKNAQRRSKQFVKEAMENFKDTKLNYTDWCADNISELRVSDEGQEGMNALLEKRSASWVKK